MSSESKQNDTELNDDNFLEQVTTALSVHYNTCITDAFCAHFCDDDWDLALLKDDTIDINDSSWTDHMQNEVFKENDNNKPKTIQFMQRLTNIISPNTESQSQSPPDHEEKKQSELVSDESEEKMESNGEIYINWHCINKSNEDIEMTITRSYIYAQLPRVTGLDDDLIKLFTIGRLNNKKDLPILINDIHSLSKVEHPQNESFCNDSMWTQEYSPYLRNITIRD